MTRIESLNLIEEQFTQTAQAYIDGHYPNKFEDDIEVLAFIWKLLYAAQDKFEQALSLGKSQLDALSHANTVFTSKSVLL